MARGLNELPQQAKYLCRIAHAIGANPRDIAAGGAGPDIRVRWRLAVVFVDEPGRRLLAAIEALGYGHGCVSVIVSLLATSTPTTTRSPTSAGGS